MSLSDDIFATTRWTLIAAAGKGTDAAAAGALEALCTAYWMPLYGYVRRRGYSREDAEDLTQAFFAKLLERNDFVELDRERGRFRAFLLGSLKHFLANAHDKAHRLKRGGTATHLSLDWAVAEARFDVADSSCVSPDEAFDREWAVALLDRVLGHLRDEQTAAGRETQFQQLRRFLTVEREGIHYRDIAAELGTDEGRLRVAVHRLRKRYRELLRQEVTRTLVDPRQVEEELRMLLRAFG